MPFHDSETEFRFYWINSKFNEECLQTGSFTKLNSYKFSPLNVFFDCDKQTISNAVSLLPSKDEVSFYNYMQFSI